MAKSEEMVSDWSSRSWHTLDFSAGCALEKGEAEKLEEILRSEPSDTTARVLLMGYYVRDARNPRSKAYTIFMNHWLWLIEHCPWHDQHEHIIDFSDAFYCGAFHNNVNEYNLKHDLAEIESGWRKAVEKYSDNIGVMANAADFFRIASPRTSEELLKRIEVLEPNNIFLRREKARRSGQKDD